MAAPVDRQVVSVGSQSSTVSATFGSAALAGSMLTANVSSRNGNTLAPTAAGWVLLRENTLTDQTTTRVYGYRAAGGETTIGFTVTGTATHRHSVNLIEWTGVAGTTVANAFDVAAGDNGGTEMVSSIHTGTTATTAQADSVALAAADSNGTSKTFTTPTAESYALVGSIRVGTSGSSTGQDAAVYVRTLNATGPQETTIAWTGSTGRSRANIIVLKGATSGTTQAESGGASSSVGTTASGAGTAVETASGGGTAAVTTAAVGAGTAVDLAPPTALTITAEGSGLRLTWTDSTSPSVTGYIIRRAVGSTPPASPTDGEAVTVPKYLIGLTDAQVKSIPRTSGEGATAAGVAGWSNIITQSDTTLSDFSVADGTASRTDAARAFAMALRYVRTGETAYRDKVLTILAQMPTYAGQYYYENLERQLGGWVLAADLLGYRDAAFVQWVSDNRYRTLEGNSRWNSLYKMAWDSPNNHGANARLSLLVANLYLGDLSSTAPDGQPGGVAGDVRFMRGFLGDRTASGWGTVQTFTSAGSPGSFQVIGSGAWATYASTWAQDAATWTPVNPTGPTAAKNGALPNDVYRDTGTYPALGASGVMYSFTALMGLVAEAALLAANGYPDVWTWSGSAIKRARDFLVTYGGAVGSNHTNPSFSGYIDPVLNKVYGTTYPAVDAAGYSFTGTRWLAQHASFAPTA